MCFLSWMNYSRRIKTCGLNMTCVKPRQYEAAARTRIAKIAQLGVDRVLATRIHWNISAPCKEAFARKVDDIFDSFSNLLRKHI
jgi:hypothetical protein